MLSIYKASAGSGKTFTLTREYIKYLLGNKDPQTGEYTLNRLGRNRHRGILAITFTNKATEEMRHRIIHELAVLGDAEPQWTKPSPYADYLATTLRCSAADLKSEARRALHELLLDYQAFQVSTIDSFFQRVLRAFAREAELTGNYEVEMDSDQVLLNAAAQLLTSINSPDPADIDENRAIEDWLSEYLLEKVRAGYSFNLFNRGASVFANLVEFLKIVLSEEFQKHSEEILEYLSDRSRIARFRRYLAATLKSLRDALKVRAQKILDILDSQAAPCDKYFGAYPLKALNKCVTAEAYDLKSIQKTEIGFKNNPSGVLKKDYEKFIDPSTAQLICDEISALADDIFATGRFSMFNAKIVQSTYLMGLLRSIASVIQENLTRDNLLMISDTAVVLKKIIADDATPFIYERLGSSLHHFLIDEFQDTSELQWHNLRPLVSEGLSTNRFDSLIIGDEKQCIYRFRNSNPELLKTHVGQQFEAQLAPPDPTCTNTNWRSSSQVVTFNNRLFSSIAAQKGVEDIYANVEQEIAPNNRNDRGYVCVNFFSGNGDKLKADDFRQIALFEMMQHIDRQIKSGYKPSQIAVLVRSKTDGQSAINYILDAQKVNPEWPALRVVSDDSLQLGSSAAVRLVIAALKVMASETDSRDSRNTSRRHLARFIDKIEELSASGTMSRAQALSQVADAECCGAFDDADTDTPADTDTSDTHQLASYLNMPQMTCANLVSIVEYVIRERLSEEMRRRDNMFLNSLIDVVNDFQQRGENNLRAFIKWWEVAGVKRKVDLPADDGAIRVMTIHKSKGLEFPCVHIPFATWDLYKPRTPEWFALSAADFPGCAPEDVPLMFPIKPSADMSYDPGLGAQYLKMKRDGTTDEINTFYVAMTRAVDELVVSLNANPEKSGDTVANLIMEAMSQKDGIFEMGAPTVAPVEAKKPKTAIEPNMTIDMPVHKSFENKTFWENTRLGNEEDSLSECRRRGLELHAVMQQITSFDSFDKATDIMVVSGTASPAEAEMIMSNLRDSVRRLGIDRWFEGYDRLMCETEIALPDGSTRRFDRAVWLPDGTVEIIDYKTGQTRDMKYREQVNEYMEAFRRMGHKKVRGYLWYLDLDIVEEVF